MNKFLYPMIGILLLFLLSACSYNIEHKERTGPGVGFQAIAQCSESDSLRRCLQQQTADLLHEVFASDVQISHIEEAKSAYRWTATTKEGVYNCSARASEENVTCLQISEESQ